MLDMNNSEATKAAPEVDIPGVNINESDDLHEQDSNEQTDAAQADASADAAQGNNSIHGLTGEEITDPNKIAVTIADTETPIVVLYGPPSCGKTMTLVRLSRYLRSKGYSVEPVRSFRPKKDLNFQRMCDGFDEMLNSSQAAKSTQYMSFMLVKVLDRQARPVCQILEAPGELYFNGDPKKPYPAYVHKIFSCSNRKVWAVMVEPDWDDTDKRANYVTRVANLKPNCTARDKFLFVLNKIDLTPYVRSAGNVNESEAIRYVQQLYPNIFVPYENQNPVTRLWRTYNCDFVPFMTGSYSATDDGDYAYTEGHERYAEHLWNAIMKYVKG